MSRHCSWCFFIVLRLEGSCIKQCIGDQILSFVIVCLFVVEMLFKVLCSLFFVYCSSAWEILQARGWWCPDIALCLFIVLQLKRSSPLDADYKCLVTRLRGLFIVLQSSSDVEMPQTRWSALCKHFWQDATWARTLNLGHCFLNLKGKSGIFFIFQLLRSLSKQLSAKSPEVAPILAK